MTGISALFVAMGYAPRPGDGAERPLEAIATLEIYDLTLDLE
ncbi:hypothetical protein [Nostoc sp. DSM 114161]